MYLEKTHGYYKGTEQHTARGSFLLLIQPERETIGATCCADNTYAIVRKVALHQCGHFMMGRVNICGKWRTVSGAYGNDGLPMDVPALPKDAVKLPNALYEAWSKGGGHNSAGGEAQAMCDWARQQFKR